MGKFVATEKTAHFKFHVVTVRVCWHFNHKLTQDKQYDRAILF